LPYPTRLGNIPEVDDEFVTAFIASTGTVQQRANILVEGVARRSSRHGGAAPPEVPSSGATGGLTAEVYVCALANLHSGGPPPPPPPSVRP
jgi:hypothetical protein